MLTNGRAEVDRDPTEGATNNAVGGDEVCLVESTLPEALIKRVVVRESAVIPVGESVP